VPCRVRCNGCPRLPERPPPARSSLRRLPAPFRVRGSSAVPVSTQPSAYSHRHAPFPHQAQKRSAYLPGCTRPAWLLRRARPIRAIPLLDAWHACPLCVLVGDRRIGRWADSWLLSTAHSFFWASSCFFFRYAWIFSSKYLQQMVNSIACSPLERIFVPRPRKSSPVIPSSETICAAVPI